MRRDTANSSLSIEKLHFFHKTRSVGASRAPASQGRFLVSPERRDTANSAYSITKIVFLHKMRSVGVPWAPVSEGRSQAVAERRDTANSVISIETVIFCHKTRSVGASWALASQACVNLFVRLLRVAFWFPPSFGTRPIRLSQLNK